MAQLNWAASTDNRGVTEYRVHRATTTGFTPSTANRVATVASGTSYSDTATAPGTYYYRVIAADAAGNAGAASPQATAVVTADTTAPNVAISAPAAAARVAGTISVTATATDNVAVQNVQFRVDGANVGAADTSSPYALSLNTTTLTNGTHTLSAVARDAAGNTRTSANVTVTVDNALPTVSLTAPAAGALVAGTISLTATATDNAGVQDVQFRVDGANVGAADTSSPYSLSLNTTTLTNGTHTLSAVARDTAGNTRASSNVSITVDNQLPAVSISAPANGARISGTTTVTAAASDNVAVQSVDFRVDGTTVATDSSAPYTLSGETSWLADGSHTLSAVARDTAGNTRTSANVTVTVDNNAPNVSITAPANGAVVSGTTNVTASASDTVGVQNVQFRVDGANVGTADTSSPYSLSLNTTTLTDGDHVLSAVASDATGNTQDVLERQHHGGQQGPDRRVRVRRGERSHGHRRGARPRRDDLRRDTDHVRALRQRALLRRRQRLGHGAERHRLQPHVRADARGLGVPDRARHHLAHGDHEGALERPRLRAVRQQQRLGPDGPGVHHIRPGHIGRPTSCRSTRGRI